MMDKFINVKSTKKEPAVPVHSKQFNLRGIFDEKRLDEIF